MCHYKNAVAAYRMHIRCKADRSQYEAESYYQQAAQFATKHATEIGSNRLNVMWDVFEHVIENPVYR